METKIELNFEKSNYEYIEWLLSFSASFKIKATLTGRESKTEYFNNEIEKSCIRLSKGRLSGGKEFDKQDKHLDLIISINQTSKTSYKKEHSFIIGNNGEICAEHILIALDDHKNGQKKEINYNNLGISIICWKTA